MNVPDKYKHYRHTYRAFLVLSTGDALHYHDSDVDVIMLRVSSATQVLFALGVGYTVSLWDTFSVVVGNSEVNLKESLVYEDTYMPNNESEVNHDYN